MLIREIMTDHVQSISPTTTIAEACRLMRDLDVGILPICEGGKPVGVVTDRDIVIRACADGVDPRDGRVADIMSSPVFYCTDDQDVEDAADLMEEQQIRRVLVVGSDDKLAGIVSLGDLALEVDDADLVGDVLAEISEDREFGDEEYEGESAA